MGKRSFEFKGTAKEIGRFVSENEIAKECGVWTDGIGLFSDYDEHCAYRLQRGKRYKITVEPID